ncbi:hypothetical protein NDU88_007168 [Pleurodeles waltl]|uniref:Uncharacterized protein n=1 Tax=Pleurodeles waltl TaxID=8319 RepID=A0AAV7QNX6_PLEWA|nr:hypothetical protein NDU88_007168 [Pleurodeles waltl]
MHTQRAIGRNPFVSRTPRAAALPFARHFTWIMYPKGRDRCVKAQNPKRQNISIPPRNTLNIAYATVRPPAPVCSAELALPQPSARKPLLC